MSVAVSFLHVFRIHSENEGAKIKYTEDHLFEAVKKADLDKVKEILTDPDIDVNAIQNDM